MIASTQTIRQEQFALIALFNARWSERIVHDKDHLSLSYTLHFVLVWHWRDK